MNNLFFCAEKSVTFVFTGRKHPVSETIKRAKAHHTLHARNELTAHQKPSCSPIKFLIDRLVNITQEPCSSPLRGRKT